LVRRQIVEARVSCASCSAIEHALILLRIRRNDLAFFELLLIFSNYARAAKSLPGWVVTRRTGFRANTVADVTETASSVVVVANFNI
jgi:hypothetical protein